MEDSGERQSERVPARRRSFDVQQRMDARSAVLA
jgi:hypothetical protein